MVLSVCFPALPHVLTQKGEKREAIERRKLSGSLLQSRTEAKFLLKQLRRHKKSQLAIRDDLAGPTHPGACVSFPSRFQNRVKKRKKKKKDLINLVSIMIFCSLSHCV